MDLPSVATAFSVIPPELVSIAADLFSILRDLCVARAALDVAAEFPSVSFKLFEVAAQLPAISTNLSIILVQFIAIRRSSFKSPLISPSAAKAGALTNNKDDAIKPALSIFDNLSMILSVLHFLAIPHIFQVRRDPTQKVYQHRCSFALTKQADLDI